MRTQHQQHGFTLIETLIALSIVGILISLASPNYSELIKNRRVEGSAKDILHLLQYARSAAVNGKANVTVCSYVIVGKSLQCEGSAKWNNQIMAFIDRDGVAAICNDCLAEGASDSLLREYSASSDSLKITANGFTEILFKATGNLISGGKIQISSNAQNSKEATITLSNAGSASISTTSKSP